MRSVEDIDLPKKKKCIDCKKLSFTSGFCLSLRWLEAPEVPSVDFADMTAEQTSGRQRAHSSLPNPISRFGRDYGRCGQEGWA